MTSVVLVSARFAKLKAELVNILYTLPEKPMRWVDKDDMPSAPSSSTADTALVTSSSAAAAAAASAVTPIDTATTVTAAATAVTDVAVAMSSSPSLSSAAGAGEMDIAIETLIETETENTPLNTTSEANGTASPASAPALPLAPAPSIAPTPALSAAAVLTVQLPSSSTTAPADPGPAFQGNLDKSEEPTQSVDSTAIVTLPVPVPVEAPKETKVERKLKRRLKRRQNNERIMGLIQSAATPQQLLDVLIEIEEAIPKMYKYSLNDEALPSTADTCAALAVRVYVLDRRIRYDEIKDLEKQGMDRQYKPRYHFAPRCLMSSSCTKFLSHTGKCSNDSPLLSGTGSRIPDINDNLSNYANINAAYLQQRATAAALQSR